MAAMQQIGSSITMSKGMVPSFQGLRLSPPAIGMCSSGGAVGFGGNTRRLGGLIVRAATVVAPKYTSVKPMIDRVLVKIKTAEEKTSGGILLPTSAQSKPQTGEVVALGEGRCVGDKKMEISVQAGNNVVYSKYAGTELEVAGSNHIILREDDILGILNTEDIKDLKPLNDRILIKIEGVEEKTPGGVLLTGSTKEKPSIGTVIAVGSGILDKDGNREPLDITVGSTVLYPKYGGSDFKGADGTDYVVMRAYDDMAVLS